MPHSIPPLPMIMVAPNGAYKSKRDHMNLPITVDETVETALACFEAGATGLHAHVRDAEGQHCIDQALYAELLAKLRTRNAKEFIQITTEAVGRFSAQEQRDLVYALNPPAISVALKEQWPEGEDGKQASEFYHWAQDHGISVQHILYSKEDALRLAELVSKGSIPASPLQMLYVLGRYSQGQESQPSDLDPFLEILKNTPSLKHADWAICAFGQAETKCLAYAHKNGGKIRIGFENSLFNHAGDIAVDNASRVREIVKFIQNQAS